VPEDSVRRVFRDTRTPEILTITVLEFPEQFHGRVVEYEHSALAVWCAERVYEVDQFIARDRRRTSGGHTDFRTAGGVQNADGLAYTVAGEERVLPAIFAVADDRVADCRHVHAQLMGAPGKRLQRNPGRARSGALDHLIGGARRLAVFLVDVHLLAAGPRLLGKR